MDADRDDGANHRNLNGGSYGNAHHCSASFPSVTAAHAFLGGRLRAASAAQATFATTTTSANAPTAFEEEGVSDNSPSPAAQQHIPELQIPGKYPPQSNNLLQPGSWPRWGGGSPTSPSSSAPSSATTFSPARSWPSPDAGSLYLTGEDAEATASFGHHGLGGVASASPSPEVPYHEADAMMSPLLDPLSDLTINNFGSVPEDSFAHAQKAPSTPALGEPIGAWLEALYDLQEPLLPFPPTPIPTQGQELIDPSLWAWPNITEPSAISPVVATIPVTDTTSPNSGLMLRVSSADDYALPPVGDAYASPSTYSPNHGQNMPSPFAPLAPDSAGQTAEAAAYPFPSAISTSPAAPPSALPPRGDRRSGAVSLQDSPTMIIGRNPIRGERRVRRERASTAVGIPQRPTHTFIQALAPPPERRPVQDGDHGRGSDGGADAPSLTWETPATDLHLSPKAEVAKAATVNVKPVGSMAGRTAAKNRRKDPSKRGAHVCRHCGTDFTAKHNLTLHYRSHEDDRSYACEKCGSGFVAIHTRNRHAKTCGVSKA